MLSATIRARVVSTAARRVAKTCTSTRLPQQQRQLITLPQQKQTRFFTTQQPKIQFNTQQHAKIISKSQVYTFTPSKKPHTTFKAQFHIVKAQQQHQQRSAVSYFKIQNQTTSHIKHTRTCFLTNKPVFTRSLRRMNTQAEQRSPVNPAATTEAIATTEQKITSQPPVQQQIEPIIQQEASTTAINGTTPIPTPATSLNALQAEAAAIPPQKPKRVWLRRLLAFFGVSIGALAGGVAYMLYFNSARLAILRTATALRVKFDNLDYMYALATPENLNTQIKLVESNEPLEDFVRAQQVWYHDSFVLQHHLEHCMRLNTNLQTMFYDAAKQLSLEYDHLLGGRTFEQLPPAEQAKALKLQQLYTDLEQIVNHSNITSHDMELFAVMIESANNSFAISPTRIQHDFDQLDARYREVKEGIQAAQLYLSQLFELLGIASQNTMRMRRYVQFITDQTGYDEYREQCQREDIAKQQHYDEQMAQIEKQLIQLKHPDDPEAQQRAFAEAEASLNDQLNPRNDVYNSPIPIPSESYNEPKN